jgi:hypothetical protein
MPHHRKIVDEVTWLRGMSTDVFNHGPAKIFMNTGFQIPGRPAFGSWVTYGLGSENADLPGLSFCRAGGAVRAEVRSLWSSGFLPTSFQGVPFRGQGDRDPQPAQSGRDRPAHRSGISMTRSGALNRARLEATGDPEIMTRAQRLRDGLPDADERPGADGYSQRVAGDARSVRGQAGRVRALPPTALLARRMIERGVRFVQLYHTDWDHHGEVGNTLGADIENRCREVDQASAALVLDLKQRGLLEDTLVIWGGEFGRTPLGEVRQSTGRDHHINGFTIWMAGGGVKARICSRCDR